MNSRGHEAFERATRGKTETQIASELATPDLSVCQTTVHRWRNRQTTPDAARQRRIEAVYPSVKSELWDKRLPLPRSEGPACEQR